MSPQAPSQPPYELFDTQDMSPHVDVEGRPLGEHRAPEAVKAGVPMELKQCPYSGSRYKHAQPMNVSALKQMNRHWTETLSVIDFIRGQYQSRTGRGTLSLLDMWQVCKLASFLPGYLLFRAQAPIAEGQLPVSVAAAYKIIVGIAATVERLVMQELVMNGYGEGPVMTPEDFFTLVEESGDLVGLEQVCAGPANLIQEALQVVMVGPVGTLRHDEIQALVPDVDAFFRYTRLGTRVHLTSFAFSLRMQGALKEVSEQLGQPGAEPLAGKLSEALATVGEGRAALAATLAQAATALVELPPEAQTQLLDGFVQLGRDPGESQPPEQLEAPSLQEPGSQQLQAQLSSALRAAGAQESSSEGLVAALAQCLILERGAQRVFSALQQQLDHVLGYPSSTHEPLGPTGLARYFGRLPSMSLEGMLPLVKGSGDAPPA
ncbi:hypothetical protein [Hyalangium versicolor]|uniref:hypothetical protein n=1 Tax=Hyalangium versicolor TaxID=2861190 RepID=UPI001CCB5208|nr:hypothetical protein [Hyalangium versicolor]